MEKRNAYDELNFENLKKIKKILKEDGKLYLHNVLIYKRENSIDLYY